MSVNVTKLIVITDLWLAPDRDDTGHVLVVHTGAFAPMLRSRQA